MEMTVEKFAEYVINNLNRATLANAMNIADKLDNPDYYDFQEFDSYVVKYVGTQDILNFLGKAKVYKILSACYDAVKAYNSEFKYNKRMIIDDYIINLWSAVNDK